MAFYGVCHGRFSRRFGRHPRRDSRRRSKRARRADEEGVSLRSILRPRHGDHASARRRRGRRCHAVGTRGDAQNLDVDRRGSTRRGAGRRDSVPPNLHRERRTTSGAGADVAIVHPIERRAYHHRGGDRDGDGGDGRDAFAAFAAPDDADAPRVGVLGRLTRARHAPAGAGPAARQVHPDDCQRDVSVRVPRRDRERVMRQHRGFLRDAQLDADRDDVEPRGERRGPPIARVDRNGGGPRGEAVETPAGDRAGRTRVPDP
mmetsp:Transcript_5637/g.25024  ORF Transcript_5637/g.25024 Transcript_5637/m.25024 type:complete len:260 (-) Transcript_5637:563-1342(-)